MSSLHNLGFFVHNNPESDTQRSSAQAALNYKTEKEHVPERNSFELLRQSYCKPKPLNLEKSTASVLSVLLLSYAIY